MQRLEVSGAVRPLYGSLGVKGLNMTLLQILLPCNNFSDSFHLRPFKPSVVTADCTCILTFEESHFWPRIALRGVV